MDLNFLKWYWKLLSFSRPFQSETAIKIWYWILNSTGQLTTQPIWWFHGVLRPLKRHTWMREDHLLVKVDFLLKNLSPPPQPPTLYKFWNNGCAPGRLPSLEPPVWSFSDISGIMSHIPLSLDLDVSMWNVIWAWLEPHHWHRVPVLFGFLLLTKCKVMLLCIFSRKRSSPFSWTPLQHWCCKSTEVPPAQKAPDSVAAGMSVPVQTRFSLLDPSVPCPLHKRLRGAEPNADCMNSSLSSSHTAAFSIVCL